MFEEEKALNDKKHQLHALELPSSIDDFIRKGMEQGKIEKSRLSWFKPIKLSGMAAAILLFIIVASIRFSPSVAAYVGQIPAFQSLVKLVTNDKGLKLALENEFIQPVGVSDEHDGIRFTVDGVIADESRVMFFYTIKNGEGYPRVDLNGVSIKDASNQHLKEISISHGSSDFRDEWTTKEGTIDVNFQAGAEIPDTFKLEINLAKFVDGMEEKMPSTWNVDVPIDKSKFEGMKEVYELNKTVNVEGQKIHFNEMIIYPTRVAVDISYDEENSKKIFYFDDITLVDEKGNVFGTIANGTLASHIEPNRMILYFQSNYFTKPEHIYIQASSMRAMDKDKLIVEVDTEKKQLLNSPDERLKLIDVGPSPEGTVLDFQLRVTEEKDKNHSVSVFSSQYEDADGKQLHSERSGLSTMDDVQEIHFYIKKGEQYENPIRLTIDDYPTRIKGNIHIKVK